MTEEIGVFKMQKNDIVIIKDKKFKLKRRFYKKLLNKGKTFITELVDINDKNYIQKFTINIKYPKITE